MPPPLPPKKVLGQRESSVETTTSFQSLVSGLRLTSRPGILPSLSILISNFENFAFNDFLD